LKIFQVIWSWHEEYCPQEICHETKTGEEFQVDFKSILRNSMDAYLKEETSWAGACDLFDFAVREMIKLGYKRVEYDSVVDHFGSYIVDEEDHKEDENKELEKLIGESGLTKMIEHNKKVKGRM